MKKKDIKTIAIIIARGGSKRIHKKNIKLFLGQPIISYSIKTAKKCIFFDEIMVSTDDNEIAKIAKKGGVKIPFIRSQKNSSDFSTTADVIKEVLTDYKKIGINPKYVCCIYPTAPLINHKILKRAYDIVCSTNAKSVVPVVKFSYPIQRSLVIENKRLKMRWPENTNNRSQDLLDHYHDVGQFYFLNVKSFKKDSVIFSDSTYPIELPPILSQDIDNEDDWEIAEFKYKFLEQKKLSEKLKF
jgi:N-acylneuraminate cytidylyltransferase|tara:strand:+ start:19010 stop:19738 length:729 start_codon:yes stop_codon:yes gene_type:complete